MPERLVAIEGTTFMLSARNGDVDGGTYGLFARDARYLSRWMLSMGGKKLRLLTSHHVQTFSSLCVLTNAPTGELPANALTVIRRRVVGGGMEEEWEFANHLGQALEFDLRLEVDADFLDLFEVKAREFAEPEDQVFSGPNAREVERALDGGRMRFVHRDRAYSGEVTVEADPPPGSTDSMGMSWQVRLPAHQIARYRLRVRLKIQDQDLEPSRTLDDFATSTEAVLRRLQARSIIAPRLRTSWDKLYHVVQRSVEDLAALLIDDPRVGVSLPAAGLPWFMTVFGRDTLITSYQILPGGAALAWGALGELARLQATEEDPQRDAQPGRIVHELRAGPVAINERDFPYYGSIDASILFLILLHEAWRWSGDEAQVRALRPAAEAVLRWMDDYGDLDGDGFIEYLRRSRTGLESQSWKDSWDAIRFHNGTIATAPVATCEVQGYAYDAFLRTAELALGPWGDPGLASRLQGRAQALFDRFNEVYWSDQRGGFYQLALDSKKQGVDSITSNLGHLLWSGIVPAERAGKLVAQLLGPGLFSGWGIRTMSTADRGFNPLGYHCGTVWPHDNSLAVAGLHRYGYREEANLVMRALIDAAALFTDFRLPEAFAGYDRATGPFPVEYPTACSPQAWAAGAVQLMVRSALGLKPGGRHGLELDVHLPAWVHELRLTGLLVRGRLFDIEVKEGVGRVGRGDLGD